jgi:hypothetical protein
MTTQMGLAQIRSGRFREHQSPQS